MLEQLLMSLPFMDAARAKLVIDAFWPMVEAAVLVSIPLAIASFIIGMIIAVVVALIRISPSNGIVHRLLLTFVKGYISIIRGTPMLVQISVVFYGLPAIGVFIDPIPAAIIGNTKCLWRNNAAEGLHIGHTNGKARFPLSFWHGGNGSTHCF